jgi:plasmid stability protein
MASITVRRLDDALKMRLRVRAAQHGRSMEEEAREILKASLSADAPRKINLADAIRRHFIPLGGVDLALPKREPVRQPPRFR